MKNGPRIVIKFNNKSDAIKVPKKATVEFNKILFYCNVVIIVVDARQTLGKQRLARDREIMGIRGNSFNTGGYSVASHAVNWLHCNGKIL